MTSATDELRRLLDERGVKWTEEDGHTLWWGESTHHRASAYSSVLFGEDGRVYLNAMVTPEQAIDATLGNDGVERSNNGVAERERDKLKDENTKLRKLASALFDCSRDGLYTDELPCQWCDLKSQEVCERMAKELGVIE